MHHQIKMKLGKITSKTTYNYFQKLKYPQAKKIKILNNNSMLCFAPWLAWFLFYRPWWYDSIDSSDTSSGDDEDEYLPRNFLNIPKIFHWVRGWWKRNMIKNLWLPSFDYHPLNVHFHFWTKILQPDSY